MGLFGKPKRLLGLDIGSHSIKAVEVLLKGEEVCITGYGKVVLDGPDADKAEAIGRLLRTHNIKTRRAVTSVSGRSVIVRYVSMNEMTDENLRNAIKFEADKYIPFDLDEVVLDCQRLKGAKNEGGEMKVVLVAVKRSLIMEHVDLLRASGLNSRIIDVDSFALGNAFELMERYSPRVEGGERTVALIDVGATKTNINILMNSTSHFTREVYLGGNDFTEAVARRLNLDTAAAEKLKLAPGGENKELVADAIAPVVDDLGNEIHLSIDFFENQFDREIDEIYLSGGGAKMEGLPEEFSRIFSRPASLWDPIEYLAVQSGAVDLEYLKQDASELAVAVGLASRLGG